MSKDNQPTLIPEKTNRMTTPELLKTLQSHYIADSSDMHARDGGVFAPEVSVNGTWGSGSRRADALYAGFTSASGRVLVGHELKVSRSDWRHELDQLDKADTWADACHAWYVVAPSTDIVPPEELPDGWGLMLPPKSSRGKRMRIEVKATVKKDFSPPWWALRSFMARIDTLAHQKRLDEVQRIVQERMNEYQDRMKSIRGDRQLTGDEKSRLDRLDRLEKSLGLEITDWRTDIEEGRVSLDVLIAAARLASAGSDHRLRSLGRSVEVLAAAHSRLVSDVLPALAELERATSKGSA